MAKKRHRITDEEVGEMLRLKREGKTDTAIAKGFGIHRQTVGRYLKRRRNDIIADEARKQVLIEELRGHFQELANFAAIGLKWRLKASRSEIGGLTGLEVPMPGPISTAGVLGLPGPGSSKYASYEWGRIYNPLPRDSHLTQALREHTKDSDLWVHWDSWRREVADYEAVSRQVLQWVIGKTEPERWQKIDPEYMEPIQRWLFGNILRMTSGINEEKLEMRTRELTAPGAREVVARVKDSADIKPLYDWLRGILMEAETLPEWAALKSAARELKDTEKQKKLKDIIAKIDSALDGIELMRAFPGRCHLCPV
jgi:hypothetical protein